MAGKTEKSVGVKPLGDKVLLKRVEAQEKSKGGIVIPDTAKEKPQQGEVISIGQGKLLDSGARATFTVKENDRVIFSSRTVPSMSSAPNESAVCATFAPVMIQ